MTGQFIERHGNRTIHRGQKGGREHYQRDDYKSQRRSKNYAAQRRRSIDENEDEFQTGGRSYEPGFENDVRYGSERMRHWGGANNYGDDWLNEDQGRQQSRQ